MSSPSSPTLTQVLSLSTALPTSPRPSPGPTAHQDASFPIPSLHKLAVNPLSEAMPFPKFSLPEGPRPRVSTPLLPQICPTEGPGHLFQASLLPKFHLVGSPTPP